MAFADFTDNFRVSNNEDWRGSFSLTRGADLVAPWAGLPAWARSTVYTSSSAVTVDGDLYVARPVVPAVSWTSAITFGADLDNDGLTRWVLVGSAAAWATEAVDLSDAELTFAIWPSDEFGNLVGNYPALVSTSKDGEVPVVNGPAGGYGLAIPRSRVRSIAPGTYRYDIRAAQPDGSSDRIRYGLWIVDQGIS